MDKKWYKERIFGYECKVIELIMIGEYKRETLKRCRKLLDHYTVLLGLDLQERHKLWLDTVALYRRIRKHPDPAAIVKLYTVLEHNKNEVADHIEFREKHARAMSYIESPIVFYRCSTHSNCADGHLAYQGKIYINTDVASPDELNYAATHNIPSIRDVMFSEPFLCTRRNCTHFFEPIDVELVLAGRIPAQKIIPEQQINQPYRAYYDRKKFLIAAGVSKKNDSYKRTVSLIRKYKL